MRRIESEADRMNGTVTYEIAPGKWARFDARAVAKYGAAALLRDIGVEIPTKRVPVIWHGRTVGTVPADFEPLNIKSNTFLYDPRPGDFTRERDHWTASRTLGASDLEAVPGFVWAPDRGIMGI